MRITDNYGGGGHGEGGHGSGAHVCGSHKICGRDGGSHSGGYCPRPFYNGLSPAMEER